MPVLQTGLAKSGADYTIDNSLRFNYGDDAKLTRSVSAGNQKTWTLSFWYKTSADSTIDNFFAQVASVPTEYGEVYLQSGTLRVINIAETGTVASVLYTTQVLRDPASWYHIHIKWDSTPSTPGVNDCSIYINGEQVTDFSSATYPDQNDEGYINGSADMWIGDKDGETRSFSGYLAEYYFIDGTALTPSSFGETDTATNQWKPIDSDDVKDAVTFGTNGFYQKYSSTELAASFTDSSEGGFIPTEDLTVDFLVVGGGGGGGGSDDGFQGGGGGAGGYRTSFSTSGGGASAESQLSLKASTCYSVTVGAYGSGGTVGTDGNRGTDGGDSTVSTITSAGGGAGGGGGNTSTEEQGNAGGSGGGSGGSNAGGGSGGGGAGTSGQGYAGGAAPASTGSGGSGGGASAVGVTAASLFHSAAGGAGLANTISGSSVTYATGGVTRDGTDTGGANTGEGGGGGYNSAGAVGGSGIVILSYISTTAKASGGTITSYVDGDDTYQVHTFTSSAPNPRHTITANGDVANSRAQSKVGDSSIYFDGTGDYLSVPDSDDFDFTSAFTIEFWFRTSDSTTTQAFYVKRASEIASNIRIGVGSVSGKLEVLVSSGTSSWDIWLNQSVADISNDTWYHVALTWDGSTYTIWLDGVSQDTSTDSNYPTVNTASVYLGARQDGTQAIDGYLDEIRISDTARYTTTFTPSTTAFTADSNTKLLIHSDWDGGIGADSSGNDNDFTPTNLVATDQMVDSPTNNWCTMNPLYANGQATLPTYKEGNLEVVSPAGSDLNGMTEGTIGIPSSGKWYWEHYTDNTNYQLCGIAAADFLTGTASEAYMGFGKSRGYMSSSGNKVGDSVYTAYGDTWTTGDIIGVAVDMDNGSIYFAKNNTWQDSGDPTSGASKTGAAYTDLLTSSDFDSGIMPGWSDQNGATTDTTIANFGQDSSFAGNKTAQGNQDSNGIGDFYYEPPTDYLALCSSNLASPEIALPTDHFNTLLWDGDDGSSRTVSGVGFQPDLFWLKSRGIASSQRLQDSVRGDNGTRMYVLNSNSTAIESTDTSILSLTSDGFTTDDNAGAGGGNNSGENYVGWFWKAGGTAASNTDGSITSSVSANTTAGFSIVSYTSPGTDSDETVGHGLSQRPDMVIIKNLDSTYNWDVWTPALQSGYDLRLNTTDDETSGRWSTTIPTASLVTLLDTYEVAGTDDYIAYCFHSVEGYSKVGSYEGNGVVDGTFIYTGMKPSYLLIKTTNLTGHSWYIWDDKRDTINPNDKVLYPNNNTDEQTSTDYSIDFLSNGFKIRNASNLDNNSSGTYIYYAVAESPFKTSNAR